MIIRPAVATDAETIAGFWNPLVRDTTITFSPDERSPAQIAEMIVARQQSGRAFDVAEHAGRVIGFASYDQFRGGRGYARAMEHTIIMDADASGRGAGRALMASIEAHAAAAGAHSMIAGVSGENADGLAFHAAIGYDLVAVVPQVGFKFGRWLDLHLMQKFLDPA